MLLELVNVLTHRALTMPRRDQPTTPTRTSARLAREMPVSSAAMRTVTNLQPRTWRTSKTRSGGRA